MPDSKQRDAQEVLALADSLLDGADASPEQRDRLLPQAAFFTRLAATLLLESGFPALPDGFWRLLDRERARKAARQLAESHVRHWQSHTRQGLPPALHTRNPGRLKAEIDQRLAAATAETLRDLRNVRRELFQDFLGRLRCDEPGSPNPAVQDASLALLDCYWQDRKRLPQLGFLFRSTAVRRRRWWRGIVTELHPPSWKHEVSCELWDRLDKTTLYWSDPRPADDPVAASLSECRTISVHSHDL